MWVHGNIVDANLVVDVVAGGTAGVSDIADHLPPRDGLARGDSKAAHVAVAGLEAMAVIDAYHPTVAVDHLGSRDDPVRGGMDWCAERAGDVDPRVELGFASAEDGIFALPEAGGDGSDDRPEGGCCGSVFAQTGADEVVAGEQRVGHAPKRRREAGGRAEKAVGIAADGGAAQSVKGVHRAVVGGSGVEGGVFKGSRGSGLGGGFTDTFAPGVKRGQFAGGKPVEGGDFGSERAERCGLKVLLVGLLGKVGVILLEGLMVLPKLIKARRLDQHPRVRSGQASDSEQSYYGRRGEEVGVMNRNWNFFESSILFPADEQDVNTLFGVQDGDP